MDVFQILATLVALVAVVCDLRTRRIPNILTFGAAVLAIALHAYFGGWTGAGIALLGWIVGAAFFFPLFALGGMGAGDVKLLAALGACLGPAVTIWLALFSAIAGGAMGLIVSVMSGYLTQAIVNILWMFRFWRASGPKPVPEVTLATHKGPRLAYALPVFAGLMVTLWLQ